MTNIVLCGGMRKDPKVGGGVGVDLRKGKYVVLSGYAMIECESLIEILIYYPMFNWKAKC
ncbi:hypothetical protein Lal_00042608 [Lupinus albus]|nr:hypothetical protein Lal_00042608 [Lupinus albus]